MNEEYIVTGINNIAKNMTGMKYAADKVTSSPVLIVEIKESCCTDTQNSKEPSLC